MRNFRAAHKRVRQLIGIVCSLSSLTFLFATEVALIGFNSAPAYAETPVDQCGAGSSTAVANGQSGSGYSPGINMNSAQPGDASLAVGTVDPASGAYTYSVEDLSLGIGDFPARLSLERVYNSAEDGPNAPSEEQPLAPYEPGSPKWFAFGRGATHNLDVTFNVVWQSLGGLNYKVVLIRAGFQTEAFQLCNDGSYKNSNSDGSRLHPDATYSANGFRFETRDGAVALFQALPVTSSKRYCDDFKSVPFISCGVLKRWTTPNGDWAQFDYEEYYSYPSNRAEPGYMGTMSQADYSSVLQECHPDFDGVSKCNGTRYGTLFTVDVNNLPIGNDPVYNWRLKTVTNSRGYKLSINYVDPAVDEGGTCVVNFQGDLQCSPVKNADLTRGQVASVTGSWVSPSGLDTTIAQTSYTYVSCNGWGTDCLASITAADGNVTNYATSFDGTGNEILSVTEPGATAPRETVTLTQMGESYFYPDRVSGFYADLPKYTKSHYITKTITFADNSVVTYVPTVGGKWAQEAWGAWAWNPIITSMQKIEPGNVTTTYNFVDSSDLHSRPTSVVNPLGRTTTYAYSNVGALTSEKLPEGNETDYTYDVRGNLLSAVEHAKTGTATIAKSTAYVGAPTLAASGCTDQSTCNKPSSSTDGNGNVTNYSWETGTGEPLSETLPPDPTGIRPTTTYSYANFTGASASSVRFHGSERELCQAPDVEDGTRHIDNKSGDEFRIWFRLPPSA